MKAIVERPEAFLELPGTHISMDIAQISEFPLLAECLEVWRRLAVDGPPSTIDPTEMPVRAIKGISLVEWSDEQDDFVLRLSSTLIDEGHGRTMMGTTFSEVFEAGELAGLQARMHAFVEQGVPDLARREFVDPQFRTWSFVRLNLPLSSIGERRERYCMIMDPDTFGQRIDP